MTPVLHWLIVYYNYNYNNSSVTHPVWKTQSTSNLVCLTFLDEYMNITFVCHL